MAEDPRESIMWEDEVIVTTEDLKTYSAKYPPMGVYIPRGRIKVPHRRLKRLPRTFQSARGDPNSPNLLMIKPMKKIHQPLPPVDLCSGRRTVNPQPGAKPKKSTMPMTSQFAYNGNDVNNSRTQYSKAFLGNVEPIPQLPPPYTTEDNYSVVSTRDMTSLFPCDMGYPLTPQYYQHLSAIAAMAWSDCTQITEKLRRIYEETAHLSRGCDPLTLLGGRIPEMHSAMSHRVPATAQTGAYQLSNNLSQSNNFYARSHHQAKDGDRYINHAMAQSNVVNKYATFQEHYGTKMRTGLTKSPLPGIALFDPRSQQNVPYDVTNQTELLHQSYQPKSKVYGQKRKMCEQKDLLSVDEVSFEKYHAAKVPRFETTTQPNLQSLCDVSSFRPQFPAQPPAYETLLKPHFPHLLRKVVKCEKPSDRSLFMRNHLDGVTSGQFLLPSVSFSPTQLEAPFVTH